MVALRGIGVVIWLGMGLLQLTALFHGLDELLGWHWLVISILGAFVAWIPLIGTAAGIFGAIYAWGWEWYYAVLLFTWPFVLGLAVVLAQSAFSAMHNRRILR